LGPLKRGPSGRGDPSAGAPSGRGPPNRGPDGLGPLKRGPSGRGDPSVGAPSGRGPPNRGPDGRGPWKRCPSGRGPDGRGVNWRGAPSGAPSSAGAGSGGGMPRRSRRFENPTFMPRGLADGAAGAADAPLGARRNSRTTPSTIAISASDVASTVRFAPPSACAVTCTDPAASSVRPKRSDPGSRPTILAPRWRRRFPKDANA